MQVSAIRARRTRTHSLLLALLATLALPTLAPSSPYRRAGWSEPPGAIVRVKNARLTLLAGFTTIRNVGSDDFADVALKQAIEANIVPGPRMYVAAHSIGITGGHCDRNGLRPDALEEPGIEQGIANGVSQVREAVRYQMKAGADLIKFCATGGVWPARTRWAFSSTR